MSLVVIRNITDKDMIQEFDKDELILRVLDGMATPDEIQTLAQWMETDPSNEVYFDQLKKAWNLTSGPIPSEEKSGT